MRRLPVVALLFTLAAGCGGSPAAPSSSPLPGSAGAADFSGLWSGSFKYTQCSGERHCFAVIGRSDPFTLRVQQSGGRAHAVFTVSQYAVELDGSVTKDGTPELTGASPTGSDKDFDTASYDERFHGIVQHDAYHAGQIAILH